MENKFNWTRGARVFITGGTGSWGTELVRQLLNTDVAQITVMSRGEYAQVRMRREFGDGRLRMLIGDVRETDAVRAAMRGHDTVFHLAALKHVPICEDQPAEAIATNVNGTANVIRAALENGVRHVIDVSTDKAVEPINVYGMSKAIGERMMLRANSESNNTNFTCVRGGNVIGSNGSVVPYFIDTILRDNTVYVTDPTMTRFFFALPDAIRLLFKATQSAHDGHGVGDIFVMDMPACSIIDLAKTVISMYGNDSTAIEIIGRRPGEKTHEVLVSESESINTFKEDMFYRISSDSSNVAQPRLFQKLTSEKTTADLDMLKQIIRGTIKK